MHLPREASIDVLFSSQIVGVSLRVVHDKYALVMRVCA